MSVRTAVFAFCVLSLPAAAGAVTLQDVIELSKAGVGDSILTALIDADRTVFRLNADQILQLKNSGVSETVVLKMIRSRREFETASPPPVIASQGPEVVIIGRSANDSPAQVMPLVVVPYYVPVPIFSGRISRRLHARPSSMMPVIGLSIRNGEFVDVFAEESETGRGRSVDQSRESRPARTR